MVDIMSLHLLHFLKDKDMDFLKKYWVAVVILVIVVGVILFSIFSADDESLTQVLNTPLAQVKFGNFLVGALVVAIIARKD
jgi:hypothetical protein